MTNIYRYYIEIKNRTFLLLFAWITTISVSYIYKEILLFLIVKPSLEYSSKSTMYFIFTDVTEVFSVYLKIIILLGNHTLLIYSLYHLILFFSSGLYYSEYKNLVFTVKIGLFFFVCSVVIFNKVLLPISWHFFLSFQTFSTLKSLDLYFESKLNEYLNFYLTSYYICVCYCQTFVLLVFFLEYIKTNITKIKQYRKVLYCSFVVISTLVTPPDIMSQLFLSASLVLIYELLIWHLICRVSLQNLQDQPVLEHQNTRKT